jgi:hypothetical protein
MPTWTPEQQRLFDAVYRAADKVRRYAPMATQGSGQQLIRVVGAGPRFQFKTVGGANTADPNSVNGAVSVIDLATNPNAHNRWTGTAVPPAPGTLPVPAPTRGGLYLSTDTSALLAEALHYNKASVAAGLARDRIAGTFTPKIMLKVRLTRPVDVVTLDYFSDETRRFVAEIGGDPKVEAALRAMGPLYLGPGGKPSLLDALFSTTKLPATGATDYAAARAVGLAMAADPTIDGLQVTSAQDYEPTGGGRHGGGDNVVLFGPDGKPVSAVQVTEVATLAQLPGGDLEVTRFTPAGAAGLLTESSKTVVS